MMIIGSICAVYIVKYLLHPLIFQVLNSFILVGISLLITKTLFASVISAFILPILLPVSYTHLDVYKRQKYA